MAYIGANPQTSLQQYLTIDDISGSFNGVLTSFALQVGGVAPVPGPSQSNQLLISLGGVIQEPDDTGSAGFRLSGGNIIFSSAPASSTAFFGVVLAGADYIYAGTNFPDGSATTPSITFANDLDSGFFRSGSGEIAYTANGTFRLKIDSSGRVGVGTSSPAQKLTVASSDTSNTTIQIANSATGTGANDGLQLTVDANGYAYVSNRENTKLYLATNSLTALTIDSSQRVGVGTTSPSYKTQIAGTSGTVGLALTGTYASGDIGYYFAPSAVTGTVNAFQSAASATTGVNALFANANNANGTAHARVETQVGGASAGDPKFVMTVSGVTNWSVGIDNSDSDKFKISSSDGPGTNDRLAIDSSGRVGIGTTSPNRLLHVSGSGSQAALVGSTDAGGALLVLDGDADGDATGSDYAYIRHNTDGDLDFTNLKTGVITFNGTSDSEKARIDSSGRLLVGTTNAGTDSGADDLVIANDGSSSDQAGIKIRGGTAGRSQIFFSDGTTGQDEYRGMLRYDHNDDSMQFRTNASEKLRINASGAMGLGVNPEPQGSGFTNFQFGGLGNLGASSSQAAGGAIYLYNNTYRATAGQWYYLVTDEATRYQALDGRHQFDVAPSGTADTTVSFSEKLRIDPDGLKFNGDTDAANALDDYEEGTWTPSITFGGGSTGVTYSSSYNRGWYTKIGRVVVLKMALEVTNKGTSTGNAAFTVPFSSSLVQASHAQVVGTARVNAQTTMLYGTGSGSFELKKINVSTTSGAITLTDADFGTQFSIIASITYML